MLDRNGLVGIAEYRAARGPGRLTAFGLGSCVGVTIYDRKIKVGGMAHIMLPSSKSFPPGSPVGKYADTALEALLLEMSVLGSVRAGLEAKIAGGANMFHSIARQGVSIGLRNVSAAREKLLEKGIPVVGEEVGGTEGRTVVFDLDNGELEVRKLRQPSVRI